MAIGLWFQPTTANIHSGYSFASVGEWVVLAATGGTLGCVVAALAAWRIAVPHVLAAVAVALAVVGAVGWLWSASRDTIDCDDRPNVCAARYGLDEHDGRSSVALAPDLV